MIFRHLKTLFLLETAGCEQTELDGSEHCRLSCRYFQLKNQGSDIYALRIEFSGDFGDCKDDYYRSVEYMQACIYFATTLWNSAYLILDLRQMRFEEGHHLGLVYDRIEDSTAVEFVVSIVSDLNREGLSQLGELISPTVSSLDEARSLLKDNCASWRQSISP